MRILLLSPYPQNIINTINRFNDCFLVTESKVDLEFVKSKKIDYIISYLN